MIARARFEPVPPPTGAVIAAENIVANDEHG
jgi:hypothetical protein